MMPVKLLKDGEPLTLVLVQPHMVGFLRFSLMVDGKLVELEAQPVDPRKAGSPIH